MDQETGEEYAPAPVDTSNDRGKSSTKSKPSNALSYASKIASGSFRRSPTQRKQDDSIPSRSPPRSSRMKGIATGAFTSAASIASVGFSSITSVGSSFGTKLASSSQQVLDAFTPPEGFGGNDGEDEHPASANGINENSDRVSQTPTETESKYQQLEMNRAEELERLVQSRKQDFLYMKRVIEDRRSYCMAVIQVQESHVKQSQETASSVRLSMQHYYLGLSLGKILDACTSPLVTEIPQKLAMDACQLMEELEFHFASSTVQSMKMMVATNTTLYEPALSSVDEAQYSLQSSFRPSLYKWNQRPVYRKLLTPSVPIALDAREIRLSLFDLLILLYSKFLEEETSWKSQVLFETIARFNDRVQKLVLNPLKKEMEVAMKSALTEELAVVRNSFSSKSYVEARKSSKAPPDSLFQEET